MLVLIDCQRGKNDMNLNLFSNYKVLFKSIFPKIVSVGKIPLLFFFVYRLYFSGNDLHICQVTGTWMTLLKPAFMNGR